MKKVHKELYIFLLSIDSQIEQIILFFLRKSDMYIQPNIVAK